MKIITWWHATEKNGLTRLDRYSYLTESAARKAHPDAPWIMGTIRPGDMARRLEGVK